jgi:hypothetical protein
MRATTRSEKQREQSRINGARSNGPENREKVRFNSLVHGLRAEHVTLPGEDPAAFEAFRTALHDEWNPPTRTRALLVDRLVVESWKLERATKADAAWRRQSAEERISAFDAERHRRVDRALDRIGHEPAAALHDLQVHAAGVDRLVVAWAELGEALASGPAGWDRPFLHDRLMLLHGRMTQADPATIGEAGRASAKLVAANGPGGRRLPAEQAEAAVAAIRGVVDRELARLRELRTQLRDPADDRAQMAAAALSDDTAGAQLRTRYEMALVRSVRSTIKQLMELHRTGADLDQPEPVAEPEVEPPPGATDGPGHQCAGAPDTGRSSHPCQPSRPEPTSSTQVPTSEPVPSASGSLGACDSWPARGRVDAPIVAPRPPSRRRRRAAKAGSRR